MARRRRPTGRRGAHPGHRRSCDPCHSGRGGRRI